MGVSDGSIVSGEKDRMACNAVFFTKFISDFSVTKFVHKLAPALCIDVAANNATCIYLFQSFVPLYSFFLQDASLS